MFHSIIRRALVTGDATQQRPFRVRGRAGRSPDGLSAATRSAAVASGSLPPLQAAQRQQAARGAAARQHPPSWTPAPPCRRSPPPPLPRWAPPPPMRARLPAGGASCTACHSSHVLSHHTYSFLCGSGVALERDVQPAAMGKETVSFASQSRLSRHRFRLSTSCAFHGTYEKTRRQLTPWCLSLH